MNTKLIIGAGVVSLITGCCLVDMAPPTTTEPFVKQTVELAGFYPATAGENDAFVALLDQYDSGSHKSERAIFRVRKFVDGKEVKRWGGMEDDQVGCKLLDAVNAWLNLPQDEGGKMAHTTTGYGDRLGMSCSTSCPPKTSSIALVDRFKAEVLGYGSYHKKHNR
jgi:hypothetical protein